MCGKGWGAGSSPENTSQGPLETLAPALLLLDGGVALEAPPRKERVESEACLRAGPGHRSPGTPGASVSGGGHMNSAGPTLNGMSGSPCLDPWKPSKPGIFLCPWCFFLVWRA